MYLDELIVSKLKCVRYPSTPRAKFGGPHFQNILRKPKSLTTFI